MRSREKRRGEKRREEKREVERGETGKLVEIEEESEKELKKGVRE